MKISIVVPFHNEEKTIERCIQSLLALDYPEHDYEILMVDNNSTDSSVAIVEKYSQVRLLRETRQGDFAARNLGLAQSTGEVIAFTDSDTAPFADWLRQIRIVMSNPAIAVIIGNLQFAPDSHALALMAAYEEEKAEFVFSSQTKEIYFGYTCNMIVRKKVFDELGPFPPVYRNSDVVMVRKAVDAYGCDAVCYSKAVSVRRLEVSSLWVYFAKRSIYGRDYNRYGDIASARPLNSSERLEIFRHTIRNRGYSIFTTVYFLSLLVAGALCYELARRFTRAKTDG